jgi:FKBP-type peptidyl-prolyl cis-trans isomerase FkpA
MKLKLPLVAACAALISLTACGGGGGGDNNSASSNVTVASPAQFSATDTTVGAGAEATAGKQVLVNYTGWLYSDTAADHKGTRFDSGTHAFVVGSGTIPGFAQGLLGMKVGGKRTVLIPASLGYGASGSPPAIPPNAGLVFDLELTAVQ